MRKLVLLATLMSAAFASIAEEISGIGELKIGMDVEDFLISQEMEGKEILDTSVYARVLGDGYVWKTTSANKKSDEALRIYSDDIVRYEFKSSIGINNIYGADKYSFSATFYKGRLATLSVYDDFLNVEEPLRLKYGKPIVTDFTKIITCQNGFGAKSKHIDGDIFYEWGKGKVVRAVLHKSVSDCGRKFFSQYSVENASISKNIFNMESKARKSSAESKAKATKL